MRSRPGSALVPHDGKGDAGDVAAGGPRPSSASMAAAQAQAAAALAEWDADKVLGFVKRQCRFFQQLPMHVCEFLVANTAVRHHMGGSAICRQNDFGASMFIVLSGKVGQQGAVGGSNGARACQGSPARAARPCTALAAARRHSGCASTAVTHERAARRAQGWHQAARGGVRPERHACVCVLSAGSAANGATLRWLRSLLRGGLRGLPPARRPERLTAHEGRVHLHVDLCCQLTRPCVALCLRCGRCRSTSVRMPPRRG